MQRLTCFSKPIAYASGVSIAIATLPLSTWAVSVKDVPNPRQQNNGWVTDMANVFSPQAEAKLNQMISTLEAQNGSEIAVVTVFETAPAESPKTFATSLFNHWGIGKRDQDNGVLFLISKGDRRVEIETGYGVEAILPDAKVGQIIDSQILPQFKKGNFDQGAIAGTQSLVNQLSADTPITPTASDTAFLAALGLGGLILGRWQWMRSTRGVSLKVGQRSRASRTHYSTDLGLKTPRCSGCQTKLQKVNPETLSEALTRTEKAAQSLGSVKFVGWQCPQACQSSGSTLMHIRAYIWNPISFQECPECREYTVKHTVEILEMATTDQPGKNRITETCTCCDYQKEYEAKTHLERNLSSFRNSSKSSNDYSGAYTDSYSGGGGGGYSGGDFGGGSSGGGGAGGSW